MAAIPSLTFDSADFGMITGIGATEDVTDQRVGSGC